VDHFTYILDLIESYEAIYPDTMQTFLFEEAKYRYFDSPVSVKPLAEKKGLNADQKVRQYHSLRHPDEAKQTKLNLSMHQPGWVQLNGQDYTSNLFEKLLVLILNKHANLDPLEYGIEMEAEKPGWNDAMNGLPGIFGSGVSETIELLRLIRFLSRYEGPSLHVPGELQPLFESLRAFPDYKKRVKVKEDYRESIRFGLKGDLALLPFEPVKRYLESLSERLLKNLQALEDDHHGLLPSFLYYEETSEDTYQLYALPHFLEAPARYLKLHQKEPLKSMHQKILKSKLYDPNLNIYKTSIPLKDAPDEIGRIKAFTEGWLERESNFLHMTYKYILGLLKAGLYEEYYEALNTNLVCFMDPSVYGRSPLENSSFIVPSNNPDPSIHGQGFFARLSGSTVEALHMWFIMMTGGKPFSYENGQLKLNLHPKLHASYFDQDDAVEFKLFHQTTIRYENPSRISTYEDCEIKEYLCEDHEGEQQTYDVLEGEVALKVREGHFKKITILISKIGGKQ